MSVPYLSSKSLWVGFDNIRSVTLKVKLTREVQLTTNVIRCQRLFEMQFLKEHGYGGVIIWSLDLDDKSGEICHEGPFPLFNAAKRELLILPGHLSSDTGRCSDENSTLVVEQVHSRTTTIVLHRSKRRRRPARHRSRVSHVRSSVFRSCRCCRLFERVRSMYSICFLRVSIPIEQISLIGRNELSNNIRCFACRSCDSLS
jgi:hypothetical protein